MPPVREGHQSPIGFPSIRSALPVAPVVVEAGTPSQKSGSCATRLSLRAAPQSLSDLRLISERLLALRVVGITVTSLSLCLLDSAADEVQFRCAVCLQPFRSESGLTLHGHVHTGDQPFTCGICDATFKSRTSCVAHIMATHPDRLVYVTVVCGCIIALLHAHIRFGM